MSQTLYRRDDSTVPRLAAVIALAAFLALVWYATREATATLQGQALLPVAIWGVAVVFGGMFLAYTWSVAFTIIERERARGAIERGSRLASEALAELRNLEDRRPLS